MSKHFFARPARSVSADPVMAGVRLHQAGQYDEARRKFERVLKHSPHHPFALWHLGRTLMALERLPQSIACLEQAVAVRPEAAEPRYDLGAACLRAKRYADAVQHLTAVSELMPDGVDVWSSLGFAQCKTKRYDDAVASLSHALTLNPNHAESLNRLGIVYAAQQRFDEAVHHFLRALELQPGMVQAWSNLGGVFKALNQLDEALVAYGHANTIDPKNAAVKFNQAIVRLLQGDLRKDVWLKYEYRWVVLHESPHRGFKQPLWQGTEPIAGKSILVYAEQGLGDTLQFVRYVPLLAARGATVHVEVQPPLKALLSPLAGATSVLAKGDALPDFDLQCPLLTLPFAFDTTLETIPAEVPYVEVPADRAPAWAQRLGPARGLRVGVVWRGNPNHANDANRSMPFGTFRRLCETTDGCEFIALQVKMNEDEAGFFASCPACTDATADLHDFADTAALIAHLDVVLAVDTSVAHLAGAMGKPTWVMLPYSPDWRWLMDRSDNPWYPSVRLFRQRTIGDWEGVLSEVQAALSEHNARFAPALADATSEADGAVCA